MHNFTRTTVVATILAIPISANATGRHECEATDRTTWLSQAQLAEKLEAQGWHVRRMKEDGGCWEVYGTNPDGLRVEGYFHPVSGAPELITQRGRVVFRAD